ncbi:MAG: putative methyltransferase, contains repeat [Rhizobacter sp.]|nr:putative methyltransferase, contains repeat [Rhizobacter sp.]
MASDAQAPDRFEQAKALFIEGVDLFESGRFEPAEQRFVASLELLPGRVSTLVNLAAVRLKLGRPEDALAVTDQVLAVAPDDLDAWLHRGAALSLLGRHAQALASHDRVLALDAHRAPTWLHRGQALQHLDRHEEALVSYDRALQIDATLAQAWTHRGSILRDMKRLDEAATAFRRAIEHGGDAELNGYYLAAVGASAAPPTAPGHYVETLFDDYAGSFDEHLVRVLGYQAHAVLAGHLAELGRARFRSALDLGCGTGLCGPLVKPLVQHLVGVDLSSQMLEKAAAHGVYDELVHADIAQHLRTSVARHDLVLAADVFIYVGDLLPVFEALRDVIDTEGVFCFSAELASDEGMDFELLPSLRYAHSQRYVRELAARFGFEVAKWVQRPIREEQSQPIEGFFAYLMRR